jgi:hypothetical protein
MPRTGINKVENAIAANQASTSTRNRLESAPDRITGRPSYSNARSGGRSTIIDDPFDSDQVT